MIDEIHLRIRLKNCLQTILDLKDDMYDLPFVEISMGNELGTLQSFLDNMDAMAVTETDVLRVERATEKFLRELGGLLGRVDACRQVPRSRLQ
jgi:hypothetical protein